MRPSRESSVGRAMRRQQSRANLAVIGFRQRDFDLPLEHMHLPLTVGLDAETEFGSQVEHAHPGGRRC